MFKSLTPEERALVDKAKAAKQRKSNVSAVSTDHSRVIAAVKGIIKSKVKSKVKKHKQQRKSTLPGSAHVASAKSGKRGAPVAVDSDSSDYDSDEDLNATLANALGPP